MVDIFTIMGDIKLILNNYIKDNKINNRIDICRKSELQYVFVELNNYIKKDYFYNNVYKGELKK